MFLVVIHPLSVPIDVNVGKALRTSTKREHMIKYGAVPDLFYWGLFAVKFTRVF